MQGLLGSKNLMKWFQKNFISLLLIELASPRQRDYAHACG